MGREGGGREPWSQLRHNEEGNLLELLQGRAPRGPSGWKPRETQIPVLPDARKPQHSPRSPHTPPSCTFTSNAQRMRGEASVRGRAVGAQEESPQPSWSRPAPKAAVPGAMPRERLPAWGGGALHLCQPRPSEGPAAWGRPETRPAPPPAQGAPSGGAPSPRRLPRERPEAAARPARRTSASCSHGCRPPAPSRSSAGRPGPTWPCLRAAPSAVTFR